MGEKLLLMHEKREWTVELKSTFGEAAVKVIETTTKDLEYYMTLADRRASGFERTASNFEGSSTVGKMILNSITCYRQTGHEGRINRCGKSHCLVLRNHQSHLDFQQPPP